ncbi:MAG: hypothetical protein IT529_23675 [Burkholderiales bacterium]|nr:hypothetical protein [Burkholderiales bacterium]
MSEAGEARKRYLARQLARYWPRAADALLDLPVASAPEAPAEPLPPEFTVVSLPHWTADAAVEGGLLVPRRFAGAGSGERWRATDWWGAADWYLNGAAECAHERAHGPVHSYSFRLEGWDARMWERAWVNRIALFLRRWAARERQAAEDTLLGPLPEAEILLTHDVDAVDKTAAIRFKQTAFHGYNALRLAARGRARAAGRKLAAAARFLFTTPDYRSFDTIAAAESARGVTSWFFVYGGKTRGRSLKAALFDPGYDVEAEPVARALRALADGGWRIGLHPSFAAWRDPEQLAGEKARVERALAREVTGCRQHWLRFGWRETWRAQQAAGLTLDATLGFNDRPGFRNGAALCFHPRDGEGWAPLGIASVPMVLMDSHLYDYAELGEEERLREMRRWLDEVRATRGVASVIWHAHVLGADYGWRPGYEALLSLLAARHAD